ncbi:MAG: energy transducer TonB [Chryseolinea sp.]
MKTEAAAKLEWEDIIFEDRNKDYGAYFLRKTYSKHVVLGWVITILVAGLLFASPYIIELIKGAQAKETTEVRTIKYTDLAPPPPIQNTPPPPQVNIPPPVKTIIKFLPPKVTDKEIVEEEEMPTIEEIKQNDVGAEDVVGTGEVVFDEPVAEVAKESNDDDMIFTVVEQQAEFPGGMEALVKFLQKNVKYPAIARRMNVEGSVFVSFVVDRAGAISDIAIVKGISAECDKEAARVVGLMPPWKPGKQNGKAVKSRFVLPVKFKLAT